ncbi:hypothetical protein [Mycobacterium hubeiense]|nr:hypothetical protein [Mycobacterium sp. QGD 101]
MAVRPRVGAGRTVAHTALSVNVELTKNIAEIGQLRLLHAAGGVSSVR